MRQYDNRITPCLLALLVFMTFSPDLEPHPGKRDRGGCHTCRTNCDQWGVPWDVKHCHDPLPTRDKIASRRVVSVLDGDTVILDNRETVRLLGIDSPEKGWKEKGIKKECFSSEATHFLEERVLGKRVAIESDPKGDKRDKYGRTLAYLYRDGSLVNAELLKGGYALALTSFRFSKKDEFKRYEKEGREGHRGLWGACKVVCKGGSCKIKS